MKNSFINRILRLFVLLSISFLATPLFAVDTYDLPSGEWRQISLPADPGNSNNTVSTIFADDIAADDTIEAVYGIDWIVYAYDSDTERYLPKKLTDTLKQGAGYWIIQVTGRAARLDMPDGSTAGPDPFTVLLKSPEDGTSTKWNMLGHPLNMSMEFSDYKIQTSSGVCSDQSCNPEQAEQNNIFHNRIWRYTGGMYEEISGDTQLHSWDGFWCATLSNSVGLDAKLIMPIIEKNWVAIPELTDEFDSGINDNKWYTFDPDWQGRFPGYFEPNNVSVEGGLLKLKSRKTNNQDDPPYTSEGTYTYATAAFKSKNKVKYGYFEVKAKAVDSGYWNSFWLYDATDTDWTEIDVYEIVASENYRFSTAHLFYARPEYEGTIDNHIKAQKEFFNEPGLTEYHTYGLDWNKDTITWYVDGAEVFTTENKHWHQPLYVLLDVEVSKWPGYPGSTEETYEIEYIRAWKNKNINGIRPESVRNSLPRPK